MARMIVGTLLDVGLSNRPIGDIEQILKGSSTASAPAKPHGLFMEEAAY